MSKPPILRYWYQFDCDNEVLGCGHSWHTMEKEFKEPLVKPCPNCGLNVKSDYPTDTGVNPPKGLHEIYPRRCCATCHYCQQDSGDQDVNYCLRPNGPVHDGIDIFYFVCDGYKEP